VVCVSKQHPTKLDVVEGPITSTEILPPKYEFIIDPTELELVMFKPLEKLETFFISPVKKLVVIA